VELKEAILEWFATCVDTQPGIVEVLLNIPVTTLAAAAADVQSQTFGRQV